MNANEKDTARRLARKLFANAEGLRNEDDSILIIDRRFWGRGKKGYGSLLTEDKDEQPSMCCLGFLCLQRGMTTTNIYEAGTPSSVRANAQGYALTRVPRRLTAFVQADDYSTEDTPLTDALVEVNDARLGKRITNSTLKLAGGNFKSKTLRDERMREALIRRLFAKAEIQVQFVG